MNRPANVAIGLVLLIGMTTLSIACLGMRGVAGGSKNVSVSCEEFMEQGDIKKSTDVGVGDSLKVTLCSNPTTGFRWELVRIADQTIVKEVGHEFRLPNTKEIVGAAGNELWTFKALKRGTTEISMDYSRPWQGGEKREWTLGLIVVGK